MHGAAVDVTQPDMTDAEINGTSAAPAAASRGLHLMSCYLPDHPFVDSFIAQMAAELGRHGHELLLLPTYEPSQPTVQYIRLPYALAPFRALSTATGSARGVLPVALAEAEAAYQHLGDGPWDDGSDAGKQFELDCAAASGFLGRLLDAMEPDTVSVWNPSVPAGRLLQLACHARGIPCFAIERGLLPDTMMLESVGIGAHSDLALNHALRSLLATQVEQPKRLAQLRAASEVRPRHASHAPLPPAQLKRLLDVPPDSRLCVLFLSMSAANWTPRSLAGARFCSPWFSDAAEAAEALLAALPEDTYLLVQAHPIDQGRWLAPPHPRLRQVAGQHLQTLFDAADLLAVLGASTIQHDVLLTGRPQLLMSRSQLSGLGLAYEYRGDALDALVTRALSHADAAEQRSAAARYLPMLLDHFLFGCEGGLARHTAADLARHLAQLASGHGLSADARIARWLEAAAREMPSASADALDPTLETA